ncbi:unnamed protein product [Sordaria macrospora k-hell]|uniref:WGS project CABT00000000 data, contig 2.35 n=1 Tax=Sordaria macrospora (strain ATCC MYA-333 / DSM 997 / K(L3346) / K-hell) TaxID=771870 RepID=F7W6Q4_SORMK|nr:uncharacterized protein SMAC_06412 [Sordaria macrospora k-hell]CCC13193.1 unnamed protein product [Sordaria macrospora k-hell]
MADIQEPAITEDFLSAVLKTRLNATHVEVTDMSGGCGASFTSLIVSPDFVGKNSLKRHRLVNAALKEEIARIHAWSAKCQTPEEYAKEKAARGATTARRWMGRMRRGRWRVLLSEWKEEGVRGEGGSREGKDLPL